MYQSFGCHPLNLFHAPTDKEHMWREEALRALWRLHRYKGRVLSVSGQVIDADEQTISL